MTVLPPVIEVRIQSSDEAARRQLVGATADLCPGALVRLSVGDNLPPLWVAESLRTDLTYQPVAASGRIADAWMDALRGARV